MIGARIDPLPRQLRKRYRRTARCVCGRPARFTVGGPWGAAARCAYHLDQSATAAWRIDHRTGVGRPPTPGEVWGRPTACAIPITAESVDVAVGASPLHLPPRGPAMTSPTRDLAPQPWVGASVIYHARTRGYSVPAIVTASTLSLDPEGVRRGDVPPLSSGHHAHLHVLTPGEQVQYQEHDAPHDPSGAPGTWCWPDEAPRATL